MPRVFPSLPQLTAFPACFCLSGFSRAAQISPGQTQLSLPSCPVIHPLLLLFTLLTAETPTSHRPVLSAFSCLPMVSVPPGTVPTPHWPLNEESWYLFVLVFMFKVSRQTLGLYVPTRIQMHTQTHFPLAVFILVSTPEPLFYSFIKQVFIRSVRHILDPRDRAENKTDKNLYPRGGYSVVRSGGQQDEQRELQIEGNIGANLAYSGDTLV